MNWWQRLWCRFAHGMKHRQYWTEYEWLFWRCDICGRHWKTPRE